MQAGTILKHNGGEQEGEGREKVRGRGRGVRWQVVDPPS